MFAHAKTNGFSYLRLSPTLAGSQSLKEKGDSLSSLAAYNSGLRNMPKL